MKGRSYNEVMRVLIHHSSRRGCRLFLHLVRRDVHAVQLSDHFPNTIRPTISRANFIFTVEAYIGTPRTKKAFIFDLGSELIWTQCTPCINCFKQEYPLFDPTKSKYHKRLPPNHTLSRYFWRSSNGDFMFYLRYGTKESASGIVSVETFSFPNQRRTYESIKGVAFGCANNQQGRFLSSITGIMGMSKSPLSLISQVGAKQFSYCLPPIYSTTKTTLLRFGNNVKFVRSLQESRFLTYIDYNYRTRAYNVVVRVLTHYFNWFNLTRSPSGLNSLGNLCYRLRPGFSHYPNMTFHFMGANLGIGPENMFHVTRDRFCQAILEGDNMTILGAYQQQNVRFVYDVGNEKVLFGKDDCSLDRG
ncbi:Aspartyl protease [Handroanthus impetiginosus]|uniref:Aspartyl protease n=1 Tax=Handroanthus impetiginosus TaxID=429701 RepID=A0A2G9G0W4_9LAMI|nr:Aspartyl protease [Handroanthus impetiginosus]